MPKNLSTIGGATKLRFGKNCREDQAENSIVFNASEEKIDATGASGLYITPLELASIFTGVGSDDTTNTFVAYNQSTHQLFRTQVPLSISALSGAGGNGGDLTVTGNLYVTGNVTSVGTIANIHVTNTTIKDGLVEIGTNNTDLVNFDLGHIYNRPVGSSNVAVCYDASATEFVIAYTDSSAMEVSNIVTLTEDDKTMNVHVYGKLYTNSNIGAANTAPVHTLSVGTKCFIDGDGDYSNVIEARGNTYTTGNVYVEGGLITNTGGVTKKTYSHQGTYASGTSVANAKLTLTFSQHAFYAKIVAQLLDNLDTEVSTMTLDIAGGERGGDATPLAIAMGPMSIFGNTNTNPWSSTVDIAPTTVAIKPSFNLTSGNYNIFVEYISRNTAGELTSLTVGTGSAIPFGY